MANDYKNLLIGLVVIVILGYLVNSQFNLFALAGLGGATFTRSMPDSVAPNEDFTLTFTAAGMGAGSYGVLITENIGGGCTPATITDYLVSPGTKKTYKITAPASGSCTFSGTYQFASGTENSISGPTSINIKNIEECPGQTKCSDGTCKDSCEPETPKNNCSFQGNIILDSHSISRYPKSNVASNEQCIAEERICNDGVLSGSATNLDCIVEGTNNTNFIDTSSDTTGGAAVTSKKADNNIIIILALVVLGIIIYQYQKKGSKKK